MRCFPFPFFLGECARQKRGVQPGNLSTVACGRSNDAAHTEHVKVGMARRYANRARSLTFARAVRPLDQPKLVGHAWTKSVQLVS